MVAASVGLGAMACSDGGSEQSRFCVFYQDFVAGSAAAEAAPGSDEVNPDLDEIIEEAGEAVPAELESAWDVITDSRNDFADARAEAGIDAESADEEEFEEFDMSAELEEAEREVAGWAEENCEPVRDL
jgi:hypothetical protein